MPTLLGYLAKFGSFSTQSEVLCTQGLTHPFRCTRMSARHCPARWRLENKPGTIFLGRSWFADPLA
jgi:hypothetical protein